MKSCLLEVCGAAANAVPNRDLMMWDNTSNMARNFWGSWNGFKKESIQATYKKRLVHINDLTSHISYVDKALRGISCEETKN